MPDRDPLDDFLSHLDQPTPEAEQRMQGRFDDLFGDAEVVPFRPGGGGGRSRRTLVVAVAAVVVVLAGTVAVVVARSGRHDQPTVSTPSTLGDLRVRAAAGPDLPVPPGRYLYGDVRIWNHNDADALSPATDSLGRQQTWLPAEGAGRSLAEPIAAPDFAAADPRPVGPPADDRAATDLRVGPFTYAQLRAAPTSVAGLAAAVDTVEGPAGPWARMQNVADLLASDATPPAVRAGLYDLLADQGATVTGPARDAAGRRGVGVAVPSWGSTFVVDPATGRAWSVESSTVADPTNPGWVRTLYLRQGLRSSTR